MIDGIQVLTPTSAAGPAPAGAPSTTFAESLGAALEQAAANTSNPIQAGAAVALAGAAVEDEPSSPTDAADATGPSEEFVVDGEALLDLTSGGPTQADGEPVTVVDVVDGETSPGASMNIAEGGAPEVPADAGDVDQSEPVDESSSTEPSSTGMDRMVSAANAAGGAVVPVPIAPVAPEPAADSSVGSASSVSSVDGLPGPAADSVGARADDEPTGSDDGTTGGRPDGHRSERIHLGPPPGVRASDAPTGHATEVPPPAHRGAEAAPRTEAAAVNEGVLRSQHIKVMRELAPNREVQRLALDLDDARISVSFGRDGARVNVLADPTHRLDGDWAGDAARRINAAVSRGDLPPGEQQGGHFQQGRRQRQAAYAAADDATTRPNGEFADRLELDLHLER